MKAYLLGKSNEYEKYKTQKDISDWPQPNLLEKMIAFLSKEKYSSNTTTERFNLKEYRSDIFEVDSTGVCLIFEGEIENWKI